MATSLNELMTNLPQIGRVEWIGVRPDTRTQMQVVEEVEARQGQGLTGDRFKAMRKTREVSLIQQEHINAVASFMGLSTIDRFFNTGSVLCVGPHLRLTHFQLTRFVYAN